MAVRTNTKKLLSICPVKLTKSVCPSIRKTRQIRRELLTESKAVVVNEKRLTSLRKRLRDRRVKGISVDCETCVYNVKAEQAV